MKAERTNFEKALSELPNYILGYDPVYHKTPDDLSGLVQVEIDLAVQEGTDYSEIKTKPSLRRCFRYVEKWKGVS